MKNDEDALLIQAMNKQVWRASKHERTAGTTRGRAWTPPRCAQCHHRPADIEQRDYEPGRPYFCSKECFRTFRDHIHGSRGVLPRPQKSIERAEGAGYDDI